MEKIIDRKHFQGVSNIIKFNWHFYVISTVLIIVLCFLNQFLNADFLFSWIILFIISTTIISLGVSFYIYDCTKLYDFDWIAKSDENLKIVNINAGFDETSLLFKSKFKNSNLKILDFYNPEKHTEISIERARKSYPSQPETVQITTSNLNLETNSVDKIFLIFAAHEIRNDQERILFFAEINRVLKPNGQLFVMEHLRDLPNLFAYSLGFFHFLSKSNWRKTFEKSNFKIDSEQKKTIFISIFKLSKNGKPS